MENWKCLPASLDQRLRKFAADIRPPMFDDEFGRAIGVVTDHYGKDICRLARDHLDRKLAVTEVSASRINPADLDKARPVAERYLTSRLGRRLGPDQRQSLLERATAKIGTDRSVGTDGQPGSAQAPIEPVSTVNPKTCVSNGTKRKVLASTPSPVQVRNRFSVLSDCGDDPIQSTSGAMDEAEPDFPVGLVTPGSQPQVTKKKVIRKARNDDPSPSTSGAMDEGEPDCPVFLVTPGSQSQVSMKPVVRITRIPLACTTPKGVQLHEEPKEALQLEPKPTTKTLVIGDSNLRNADATKLPGDWEIHSYPGAKFKHVKQVLKGLKDNMVKTGKPDKLDRIIIQVGINHRGEQVENISSDVSQIEQIVADLCQSAHFVGISTAESLDDATHRSVSRINQYLSQSDKLGYIPPLNRAEVYLRPNDTYGIHFDESTLGKVVNSIVSHVTKNSLN